MSAKTPVLTKGSPAAMSRAASSEGASTMMRLPFMVAPSSARNGPASTTISPRLFRYSTCCGRLAMRTGSAPGLSVQISAYSIGALPEAKLLRGKPSVHALGLGPKWPGEQGLDGVIDRRLPGNHSIDRGSDRHVQSAAAGKLCHRTSRINAFCHALPALQRLGNAAALAKRKAKAHVPRLRAAASQHQIAES